MQDPQPPHAHRGASDHDEHSLLAEESRYGDRFRQEHPKVWLVTLIGPFIATAAILVLTAVVQGADFMQKLFATALATFFFFGRFVILGGAEGAVPDPTAPANFLSRGELFLMVMWMDIFAASIFVYHAGFIYRLPWIGKKLLSLVKDGQFILAHQPWIRRATFIGLIAFVAFPLAATGSVGGSIFGRLLGLTRGATFVGIFLGSLLGCGSMYLFAGLINRYLDRDNPWLTISGVGVVVGIILLLNWRYHKMKKAAFASGSTSSSAS
jgi:Putative small multi-drug export protein